MVNNTFGTELLLPSNMEVDNDPLDESQATHLPTPSPPISTPCCIQAKAEFFGPKYMALATEPPAATCYRLGSVFFFCRAEFPSFKGIGGKPGMLGSKGKKIQNMSHSANSTKSTTGSL